MDEKGAKKLEYLITDYSKKIDSYADFGSDLWFIDLERNRRYKKITESLYTDINSLGKCVHIRRKKDGSKEIVITDLKELEKILNSVYEPSLSVFEKLALLKETAANYSKKINSYADFGSELWEVDLERNRRNGVISIGEYNKIKLFAKENLELVGTGQNAIDKRWEVLFNWANSVTKTDTTLNKEIFSYKYSNSSPYFNENEYNAFKQKLETERQNAAVSDYMYMVLSLAFDDTDKLIQESKRNAEKEFLLETSIEEKEHKAKSRSLWIFIILMFVPSAIIGALDGHFVTGILIWGIILAFGGIIILPLHFFLSARIARSIAEATIFTDGTEPSEKYKNEAEQAEVALLVSGAIAGASIMKERKGGWIKDSKQV